MTTSAITGVTGHLGGFVAKELSEAGVAACHLACSSGRVPKLTGTIMKKCSYEYPDEVIAALSGIDVFFMILVKEDPERLRQHRAFIDATKAAGVKHVVYTSLYNVSPDSTFILARDYAATEQYIKEKGLAYIFLCDNFHVDFFVDMACQYGGIKGPVGNGKVSAAMHSDVANTAVETLKDPEKWADQTLNMAGPEELTLSEVVEQISHSLGKTVTYAEEAVEEAYDSHKIWQAEQWEYDPWVSIYIAIAKEEQAGLSNDIECVLGRRPKGLREYLAQMSEIDVNGAYPGIVDWNSILWRKTMLTIEHLINQLEFTSSEKGVAQHLHGIGLDSQEMSTRTIAEATYTSAATVVHLCKKLGFLGFEGFKEKYCQGINYLNTQTGKLDINFPFQKGENLSRISNKLVKPYGDTVNDTLSTLDQRMLNRAVTILRMSKTIHIFSYGTSLNIAESFKEKMLKIGRNVRTANNLNYQIYEASCLGKRDVAILIPYSGETEKMLQITELCQQVNVLMILLSSSGENSLSPYSSYKLTISSKESLAQNIRDFSTHLSVMFLLDALYPVYFLKDFDQHYDTKVRKAKKLEHIRSSSNRMIQ